MTTVSHLDPLIPLTAPEAMPARRKRASRGPGDTYTAKEAAQALRLNPETVVRWCVSGKICGASKATGKWLVPSSEVFRMTRAS